MSPGIAPPGSPGTFRRRKSSTTLPPEFSKGSSNSRRSSLSQVLGDLLLGQQQSQPNKMANDNLPAWPNTKEDYELKEVIGKSEREVFHLWVNNLTILDSFLGGPDCFSGSCDKM